MSSPPYTSIELDRDNWGKVKINPDSKDISAASLNTYILWIVQVWKEMKYGDSELWSMFKEDFEGWGEHLFNLADKRAVHLLREYLRENGVEQEAVSLCASAAVSVVHAPSVTYQPTNLPSKIETDDKQKLSEISCKIGPSFQPQVNPPRPQIPELSLPTNENFGAEYNNNCNQQDEYEHHWTDKKFHREGGKLNQNNINTRDYQQRSNRRGGYNQFRNFDETKNYSREFQRDLFNREIYTAQRKKGYIYKRVGSWSSKHPRQEQNNTYNQFAQEINESDHRTPSREEFYHLLIDTEGIEESDYINITETSEALGDLKIDKEYGTFWTEMGEIDGFQTVAILNDQSVFHGIIKEDIFVDQQAQIPPSSVFTCERYLSAVFHGIIPDTGAAGVSTAGHPQVEALMNVFPEVTINIATAGQHQTRFGKGLASTIGTICFNTMLGQSPSM
ncbi:integrase and RNaseH domain-containing protein [Golovinomyces cichoracearum]|uniref:Integrase and RNaseH domain-containing protein n=1 Tax=Golovinomyces cichoracearum TaxID=62708 RepID=A0A420J0C3_9PEZI|nr:integrase and RNaseH domain-containing protein [Golovinomyces cichoracearum]